MAVTEESMKSPRVQRKREQARHRILEATEALVRARGVEDVTIQDITEAADVGHGTFYTHFKTKMEVLVPIVETHAQDLTKRIDRLTANISDSAVVVSVSVRHLLRSIAADPLWTWFLCNVQLPMETFRRGVGDSGRRDMARGMAEGRFTEISQDTLEPFLIGALVGVVRERSNEISEHNAAEDSACMVLQLLGVPESEVREIAYGPLPPLPADVG